MTQYTLRDYQADAVSRGCEFMLAKRKKARNGLVYIPTGGGKSLILGSTAIELASYGPVIVSQPTKEILEQNLEKIRSYGFRPEVCSASMGKRNVGEITMTTIGTIFRHPEWFEDFQFGLVDEAHLAGAKDNARVIQAGEEGYFHHRDHGLVSTATNQEGVSKGKVRVVDGEGKEHVVPRPKKSMYKAFFEMLPHISWLGYTASPYRLVSDAQGSKLSVITRTIPRIWNEFVHWTQNRELFDVGYLAKLEYHQIPGFKRSRVEMNSTGADYDAGALQLHLWEDKAWETKAKKQVNFPDKLTEVANRLLDAGRENILVFTSSIRESEYLAEQMKGECAVVTGETSKADREDIVRDFRSGDIKVLSNVGVMIHGFDYPELATVIDASPTMSLSRYYQKIGRIVRRDPNNESKVGWVIDMVEGYKTFGRVEDLTLYCQGSSMWDIFGRPGGGIEKRLTSTYLGNVALGCCPKCHVRKIMAYYPKKNNWLPLSLPPAGSVATVVMREENNKRTIIEIKRGHPDAEFCLHFTVCAKFAALKNAA